MVYQSKALLSRRLLLTVIELYQLSVRNKTKLSWGGEAVDSDHVTRLLITNCLELVSQRCRQRSRRRSRRISRRRTRQGPRRRTRQGPRQNSRRKSRQRLRRSCSLTFPSSSASSCRCLCQKRHRSEGRRWDRRTPSVDHFAAAVVAAASQSR